MEIVKKNGYVYGVEGHGGFKTIYNLGKDPDDPMWNEEVEEMSQKKPKKVKRNQEKSED